MASELAQERGNKPTMGDGFEMDKASIPPEAVQIEFAANTATHHRTEKSKAEKKLVRKTDWLVPAMLGGAYFFAYLVRFISFQSLHRSLSADC